MKFSSQFNITAALRLLHAFVFLIAGVHACFSQDHLDQVKSDALIVKDLKDIYRAYAINHKIDDQQETINLLMNEQVDDVNKNLKGFVKDCEDAAVRMSVTSNGYACSLQLHYEM